jgi:DNA-binding SARP family transcriptional activator
MYKLRFYLFGNVRIVCERDEQVEVTLRPGALSLLAYLLLHRRYSHRREVLADVFWGEYDDSRARRCLSTALWRLRHDLEAADLNANTLLSSRSGDEINLHLEDNCWLDVAIFEEGLKQGLASPPTLMDAENIQTLETVCKLYRGDLLDGFYEEWAIRERERLRLLYLNGLTSLMRHYQQQGTYDRSLTYGQRILNLDPLREEVHRAMMRLYALNGQRTLAMQQYEYCREVLMAEMGLAPMTETQVLYRQIVDGKDPGATPVFSPEPTYLYQALRQLGQTMQTLDEACVQVRHAVQLVSRLTNGSDSGDGKTR